jgi:hypothetical protein
MSIDPVLTRVISDLLPAKSGDALDRVVQYIGTLIHPTINLFSRQTPRQVVARAQKGLYEEIGEDRVDRFLWQVFNAYHDAEGQRLFNPMKLLSYLRLRNLSDEDRQKVFRYFFRARAGDAEDEDEEKKSERDTSKQQVTRKEIYDLIFKFFPGQDPEATGHTAQDVERYLGQRNHQELRDFIQKYLKTEKRLSMIRKALEQQGVSGASLEVAVESLNQKIQGEEESAVRQTVMNYKKILQACEAYARQRRMSEKNVATMASILAIQLVQEDVRSQSLVKDEIVRKFDLVARTIASREAKFGAMLENIVFTDRLLESDRKRLIDAVLEKYPEGINRVFRKAVQKKDYATARYLARDYKIDRYSDMEALEILGDEYGQIFLRKARNESEFRARVVVLCTALLGEKFSDEEILGNLRLFFSLLTNLDDKISSATTNRLLDSILRLQDHPSFHVAEIDDNDLRVVVSLSDDLITGTAGRLLMEKIRSRLVAGASVKDIMVLADDKGMTETLSDERGNTPLHAAVAANRDDVVNALLKAGYSALTRNADGLTPLHLKLTSESKNSIADFISAINDMKTGFSILLQCLERPEFRSNALEVADLIVEQLIKRDERLSDKTFRRTERIMNELDAARGVFLPLFAVAGRKNKVKKFIRYGATCEPAGTQQMKTMMTEMIKAREEEIQKQERRRAQEQRQRQRKQAERKQAQRLGIEQQMRSIRKEQELFSDDLVRLEIQVANELGLYDMSVLGFGSEPMIRVLERLSPEEVSYIETSKDPVLRNMYSKKKTVEELRKKIPVALRPYRIAAIPPDAPRRVKLGNGEWTIPIPGNEYDRLPEKVLQEYHRKKNWHEIVSSSRQEMMSGAWSIADYRDFLDDVLANIEVISNAPPQRKYAIPTRWTDNPGIIARREMLFLYRISPLVSDLFKNLPKKTTVFAVDTINVLRGRDEELRATDYTSRDFQTVFDAAFARHAEGITAVLEAGSDRTTIIWVCPRVGQAEEIAARPVVSQGDHRRVVVYVAVRLEDLRYTRALDDFFLLSLVALHRRSENKKISGKALVLVSEDKFRDWSEDVTGYDAAWEPAQDEKRRVQERAKKMASEKKTS